MKRSTGTHVYSFAKCQRLAALDLTLSRRERRDPTPWEAFAAKRGRDFEDEYVADLAGVVAPEYPERDFEAGAAATLKLLRAGAPLVHQAVLMTEDRLGLPDLLRKVDGPSELGDYHYEVMDVKTSGQPRSDQILQVLFYSRLLAAVQGRTPEHTGLILKDRREERFVVADFAAVCSEVERDLRRLHDDPDLARPFLQSGCESCHWNHKCLPELEVAGDLSLVQGMTSGIREILEGLGCRTVEDLATFQPETARARGRLDAALLRRLRRAAQATLLGKPVADVRPNTKSLDPATILYLLTDPFADRVLLFATLTPAAEGGEFEWRMPGSREEEWPALKDLLAELPDDHHLLHFGGALPRWYEEQSFERESTAGWSIRFVDLQRRLRAALLFPGPVFTLADFARLGLGVDPARAGHAAAAAMWDEDREQKLVAKAMADLDDLAQLKTRFLDTPAARGAVGGTDTSTATASIPPA
ncbi:MAG: TM0106 family RecB-like putative nuclease [Planctomycetota bacterium]|nr:TM0106 family RecB-like putative nuclease [Planctomycetota bacterium]